LIDGLHFWKYLKRQRLYTLSGPEPQVNKRVVASSEDFDEELSSTGPGQAAFVVFACRAGWIGPSLSPKRNLHEVLEVSWWKIAITLIDLWRGFWALWPVYNRYP